VLTAGFLISGIWDIQTGVSYLFRKCRWAMNDALVAQVVATLIATAVGLLIVERRRRRAAPTEQRMWAIAMGIVGAAGLAIAGLAVVGTDPRASAVLAGLASALVWLGFAWYLARDDVHIRSRRLLLAIAGVGAVGSVILSLLAALAR